MLLLIVVMFGLVSCANGKDLSVDKTERQESLEDRMQRVEELVKTFHGDVCDQNLRIFHF